VNILKQGMKLLGMEWQSNGTSGQEESASKDGKLGEKIASTMNRQLEIASEFP
jgi:putative transposase